jgi:hypothetical protein
MGRGLGFPTLQDGSIPAALLAGATTARNFAYKAMAEKNDFSGKFFGRGDRRRRKT